MTMKVGGGSATIYQFPARGRYAQGGATQQEATRDTQQAAALCLACVAASSGWYHDEAIEAERASRQ